MKILRINVLVMLLWLCFSIAAQSQSEIVRVGLAWQPNSGAYDRVVRSIELAGGEAVILPQVRYAGFEYDKEKISSKHLDSNGVLLQEYADMVKRNTYRGTKIDSIMQGIDAVVFLGGGDISSTLFREPEEWGGEMCDATRDVSEYLTMAYCFDKDIPVLGLCRGMQMLAVVSGASMIQDLGTYYDAQSVDYNNLHRSLRDENGNRHYTPHDVVVVEESSFLYAIVKTDTIKNVPSWHHQVVRSVQGTALKVTGVTPTLGYDVIEAVERTDKTFALGVQFHPEEAVRQHLADEPSAQDFMQLYEGVNFFRVLLSHCNNK